MQNRYRKWFSGLAAILLFIALPAAAQQSVFYLVSGPAAPITAGEPWPFQDFWLSPAPGASPLTAELFDGGLGSAIDLVIGDANTRTAVELIPFESAWIQTAGGLKPAGSAVISATQQIPDDQSALSRWIPVVSPIQFRDKGWILRVRATDGNDVNSFQMRFAGSGWTIRSVNLGLNAFDVTAGQEVQFLADPGISPVPVPLKVAGEELAEIRIRDFFEGSANPADGMPGFTPRVNGIANGWGVVIRGSGTVINNLTIRGAETAIVFDFPGLIVTNPKAPDLSVVADYAGNCTDFSVQVVNKRGLPVQQDVRWILPDPDVTGNPARLTLPGPGTFPVQGWVAADGQVLPSWWKVTGTIPVNAPPEARTTGPDRRLATGEVFNFPSSASVDPDGEPLVFRWLLNGRQVSTQPGYAFSSKVPGTFTVSLIATDVSNRLGCNSDTVSVQVLVNSQPYAVIRPVPVFATDETVTFSSERVSDTDQDRLDYSWSGPGITGSDAGPEVNLMHEKPGTYSIALLVDDRQNAQNSAFRTSATYRVNAAPVPRFTIPVQSAPGVVIPLNALATTDPDSRNLAYTWKISDNRTLAGVRQDIRFDRPGTYTIMLVVDDNESVKNSVQTISNTIQINAPPQPVISGNTLSADGFQRFSADKSRDPDHRIVRYLWDFGDGAVVAGKDVSHTYAGTGRYLVKLTVDDGQTQPNSIQSTTQTLVITKFPTARFDLEARTEPGTPVRLDGSFSTDPDGTISRWQWTVNGKPAGSAAKAEFTPAVPGQYAVSLQVTDDSGFEESTSIQTKTIQVNYPPEIRYSIEPASPAPQERVTFSAAASTDADGRIASVTWTFADGQVLTGTTVNRTFSTPGSQQFTVTVSDGSGFKNGTQSESHAFIVNHSPIIVTEPSIRSNNRDIRLDASGSYDPDGNPMVLEWILPDGTRRRETAFTWKAPTGGIHLLSLVADDQMGRPNSRTTQRIEIRINRAPIASVDSLIRACTGQTILFSGSGCSDPDGDGFTTTWDFGDSTSSTDTNPAKIYYKPGTYQVRLTLDDGFTDAPTVATIPVIIKGSPVAQVSFTDTTICVNTILQFDGSRSTDPNGPIGAYSWDFGNGDRDFGKTVNYIYKEKGTFTVTLTVVGTQAGTCSNISQAVTRVTVNEGPVADFTMTDWIAAGETITLSSTSRAPGTDILSKTWEIIDGGSDTRLSGQTVTHLFKNPGTFSIRHHITAGGQSGCNTAVVEKSIRVNAAPVIGWIVPDSVVYGNTIRLDAGTTRDPDGVIRELTWLVNGKPVGQDPVMTMTINQTDSIRVELVVKDDSPTRNQLVRASKRIRINQRPEPAFAVPVTVYEGQQLPLVPKSTTDADGDRLVSTWFVNGTELKEPTVTVTREPQTITLRQNDGRRFANSVADFSIRITGKPAPVFEPVIPGRVVTGFVYPVKSASLPPAVILISPDAESAGIRFGKAGPVPVQFGWKPVDQVLKIYPVTVQVLEPLTFTAAPKPVTLIWNPANPSISLTAPAVNRTSLETVSVEWQVNGIAQGVGFSKTIPLKKGLNRVVLTARDINVPGSQPTTAIWEIRCE